MKKGKIGAAIAAFSICVGLSSMNTFAKVNSILVNDTTSQKIYEYNYTDLSDSFEQSMLGHPAVLYNDYSSKIGKFGIYAFYDDTNKYVDFAKTQDAFEQAMLHGQTSFNIDSFTESSSAPLLTTNPTTVTDVTVQGSSVQYVDKTVGGSTGGDTGNNSDDFQVISIE